MTPHHNPSPLTKLDNVRHEDFRHTRQHQAEFIVDPLIVDFLVELTLAGRGKDTGAGVVAVRGGGEGGGMREGSHK